MTEQIDAPETIEDLREQIVRRHGTLSKRLQQIGRYVLDEPQDVAFETLSVIGARCGVQPSAIVRFAKSFGFEGASQMQKLFRNEVLNSRGTLAYAERVQQQEESTGQTLPSELLQQFVEGNRMALANLQESISNADMEMAVAMIEAAETVSIIGFRRSFPVASYLAYSLLQTGKRTQLIDGVAGLTLAQVATLGAKDLVISISFNPYAEETVSATAAAVQRGVQLLALTDSAVSPIAKVAQHRLLIREAEVRGFRSLVTSMCLAQAVTINFAIRAAAKSPSGRGRKNAE